MKAGKTIFLAGFMLTLGIIIAYLLTIIVGVAAFAGEIASIILCVSLSVGTVLMVLGRWVEKRMSLYDT